MTLKSRTGERLPIVECFHSIQGEGIHSGRGAFFIRLAGCDVGCSWCDTKNSWSLHKRDQLTVSALKLKASAALRAGASFVVITGGEPLQHDLRPLTKQLSEESIPVHLETSGVDPLSGSFDWITLSPKRHKPPTPELLAACSELKVVVHDAEDLAFAQAMAEAARLCRLKAADQCTALLVQPGHACPEGLQLAIDFV